MIKTYTVRFNLILGHFCGSSSKTSYNSLTAARGMGT